MRRSVVAVVVAAMVVTSFALVGCGGDEPEAPEPVAPAEDVAAPLAIDPAETDLSEPEEIVYEPFPQDEEALPSAIATRLDAGQPMIILFVDRTQHATDDQEAIVEGLQETYRGLIDVVIFDVSRYVSHDADGLITVKPEIDEDDTAAPVARLIDREYLDVRFTPYTVIVDRHGYITWRYRGVSDDKTLEREVIRATD